MAVIEDPPVRDEQGSRNWIRWFMKLKNVVELLSAGSGFIFTPSRAMQSAGTGALEASTVTSTELGYLTGADENIQDQLNDKFSAIGDNIGPDAWDDMRAPATQLHVNPVTVKPDYDDTHVGLLYDAASNEAATLILQLPHDYKAGTNVVPHIHWESTTNVDNTNVVVWKMDWCWRNNGEAEPGTWNNATINTNCNVNSFTLQVAEFPELSGANKLESSFIKVKLTRLGGDAADSYGADALLTEFDIHYKKDKAGTTNAHPGGN